MLINWGSIISSQLKYPNYMRIIKYFYAESWKDDTLKDLFLLMNLIFRNTLGQWSLEKKSY